MTETAASSAALTDEYLEALRAYLRGEGESALARAYEIGRRAIGAGFGLLDLASLHGRAVSAQLLGLSDPAEASTTAWRATTFFAECLAPFEIIHRGYLEANERLRRLNQTLEQEVEERTRELLAEQALRLQEAEEGMAVRDTFLSVASHELRTPLTSLMLGIQSLLKAAPQSPPLLAVERQGKRLARLFANLLEVSNLTSGRVTLSPEPVDLAALAREAAGAMSGEIEQYGSTIAVIAGGPVHGRWDRLRIEQILGNLLSNAAKYGRQRPIELSVRDAGNRAIVSVRDQGIGIAPEDQARIFGRFERAASVRHYGGFGLGLWIVHQIVTAMGGVVRVESVADEGSLFTVELPKSPP